ncbi:hypothetical protein L7F22_026640 [Adiantum nelumboides]|nr:hypothetical protein [Adiantum nelumboides]
MEKGVENPYQELKQLLEGKPSSKKKGHAQHERSPSRDREESESSDKSMEDVAPRRRRAQRSPTPTKWKRSPHSPHRRESKRKEKNSKKKKERKRSPSSPSSSPSSSSDEGSRILYGKRSGDLKQLLEGKQSSKKKAHVQHEWSPSKEREESKSQDEPMEDVAPRRRRGQRSPTPTKRKRPPHSPHRRKSKRKEKSSKKKKERKRSPSSPSSSSPSSSSDESSRYSSQEKQRRGHRRSYAAWKRSNKLKKFKEGGRNISFLTYDGTFGATDKVLAFIQQFDAAFGDEGFSLFLFLGPAMTTCAVPQPHAMPQYVVEPLQSPMPMAPPWFIGAPTGSASSREGPPWLERFLSCTYFDPCAEHQFNKNEKNHFCIDCIDGPLCSRGLLAEHAKHRTLQVRKASHADGVRVENVCKLLDISSIQTYIINNHKIVFLLRQTKGKLAAKPVDGTVAARHCQTCGRLLSDLVKFCSIKCKLLGVRRQQEIGIPTTLSLSPEVRPSPPSRGFHYIFEDLQNVSPNCLIDPNLTPLQVKALEEYQRRRGLEVAPLSMGTDYDGMVGMSSIVSPVSVLHALMPCALDNAATPKSMEATQLMELTSRKPYYASQEHDAFEDQQWEMQDNGHEKMSMGIEMMVISKLLQLARRKKRKSLPRRAPLR